MVRMTAGKRRPGKNWPIVGLHALAQANGLVRRCFGTDVAAVASFSDLAERIPARTKDGRRSSNVRAQPSESRRRTISL